MGLLDFLTDMVEKAKTDAINANKKPDITVAHPNSIKEKAYQSYKNGSQANRDAFDRSGAKTNFKERYEHETKK